MPPYYPAGLTIILETHDAGALETANVTANTGAEARQLLAQAELALSSGERLSEEVVDCLAEQGEGALKFFGKHQTMPFYCVAVNRRPPVFDAPESSPADGQENDDEPPAASQPKIKLRLRPSRCSTQAQTSETQQGPQSAPEQDASGPTYPTVGLPLWPTRSPTPVSSLPVGEPVSPMSTPLTLKIQLDPHKSFCRSNQVAFKDLKVEVFFNGRLTHSTLVPARERLRPETLTHTFSGRRIARIIEAMWILCPRQAQPRIRSSTSNFYTHETRAEERWRQISNALYEEVRDMGTDEKGKMPPSALFLRDLANLRMPFAVRDMQGSSGQMFGTIDVVMALGRGKKDAPTGIPLREPQHLRAPGGSSTNKTSARKGPSVPQAGSSTPFTDLESIAKRPMIELQEQLRTLGMPDSKADREFCWRESRPSSRSRGRYRRLARAPTKHRDVSKLRPTIAVSSSDFAVPTYYLQRKPSTSQKLIVKLNVPSPSPSKPGSHRKSGSFSRPPLEDDEADHDFAPQTPKRQGSGGRRGRGQAWRLGLRRDLSSPSGWVSKTGSSTRIPTPRQPSSPAQDQAPVAGQGSAVADPASGNKPKRRQIRQTGAAPQVQQPSLPPAAVFPTVPASRKPSVPALEPTGPSSHSRKDSGAMATASRSRTLSPEKDSRALTYTSRPITTTGPSTPAPLANPAPPRPSLSKLNTSTSSHLEFKTPAVPASRTQSRVPTPGSTRPSTPASTRPPTPSALIPEVGVPDTSRDCVIAYKPGMVRQIKSERGGTFKEEEVLVGVRFVVCA